MVEFNTLKQSILDDPVDDQYAEVTTCESLFECFMLFLYKGAPQGNVGDVIDATDRMDSLFVTRVVFDLIFFIWVGILLFNINIGLIVDTFSALRDRREDRLMKLKNDCFVCGYQRSAFDDLGGTYNFDKHVNHEHNMWNYLFFIAYLNKKDPTEYNGVESYVRNMLHNEDLNWVPVRTSWQIENQEGLQIDEDDEYMMYKKLEKTVRQMGGKVNTLISTVEMLVQQRGKVN